MRVHLHELHPFVSLEKHLTDGSERIYRSPYVGVSQEAVRDLARLQDADRVAEKTQIQVDH